MLFKPEMCQAILDGKKRQTRRLVKDHEVAIHEPPGYAELPIEMVFSSGIGGGVFGRLKWAVGNTYAIQPGRGKPAIWVGPDGTPYNAPLAEYLRKAKSGTRATWGPRVKRWLHEHGYHEARIRITGIRREHLQDISDEDAMAEGTYEWYKATQMSDNSWRYWLPVGCSGTAVQFRGLWNSIHRNKGTRWEDNPSVWVISFTLYEKLENG